MRRGLAAGVGVTLLFAGCGSQKNYKNDPRPPAPVTLSAAVEAGSISLSPRKVGAGPVHLIVANLSRRSLEVTLNEVGGNDAASKSGPINPQGTAQISVELKPGAYRLTSSRSGSATLRVGRQRRSAQDTVLLP
jgi:hypothetical protein